MFVSRDTIRRMDRTRTIFPRGTGRHAGRHRSRPRHHGGGHGARAEQAQRDRLLHRPDEALASIFAARRPMPRNRSRFRLTPSRNSCKPNASRTSAGKLASLVHASWPRGIAGGGARNSLPSEGEGNSSSRVAEGSSATAAETDRASEDPHHSTGAHAGARASRRMYLRELFDAAARQVFRPFMRFFHEWRGHHVRGGRAAKVLQARLATAKPAHKQGGDRRRAWRERQRQRRFSATPQQRREIRAEEWREKKAVAQTAAKVPRHRRPPLRRPELRA